MITRLVFITVPQEKVADTGRIYKQECVSLMIKQPGCLTHHFLHNHENPCEFVSFSAWVDQQAVDKYIASDARQQVRDFTRNLLGASKVETKIYDTLG